MHRAVTLAPAAAGGEPRRIRQSIEDSHREILALVAGLQVAGAPAEVGDCASRLAEMLVGHFRDEEQPGGFFDQISARLPIAEPRLAGLRQQHRELLGLCCDLRDRAAAGVAPLAELLEQRDRLAQLLHKHESAETRLMTRAWYTDLGSSE